MGIDFERLKKDLIDRPILLKQGQVRENKDIFKVSLVVNSECNLIKNDERFWCEYLTYLDVIHRIQ